MAVVAHWSSLAEAERLTQSHLVGGMIEENMKRGDLVTTLPIVQFTGLSAKWNREKSGPTTRNFGIGSQITWQAASSLTPMETKLKRMAVATLMDDFVADTYGNLTNYEAIQLLEDEKSMLQNINDRIIYGDLTYTDGDADGLHALAQASPTNFAGDSLNVDMAEAGLSLKTMRDIEDAMIGGIDYWIFPFVIANRLDAYMQEAGIATNTFGQIQFGMDDVGKRITSFNSIPILRSDYSVAEQANTGVGSDARAKHSSGDKQYSVFAVKRGNVLLGQPGLSYSFGGRKVGPGQLWKSTYFEEMEDTDESGIRLVHYGALLDGASTAIARIYDIEDLAIVA